MNRERLTILRDHLASLPDERVNMSDWRLEKDCGTACCIGGWACFIWGDETEKFDIPVAKEALGLSEAQGGDLFFPAGVDRFSRTDAIAALQSMLDSPDDDALPVWPEVSL